MTGSGRRGAVSRAIRGAARGEAVLAPSVAARLMGRMRAPAEEALSAREIECLTWSPEASITRR